MVLHMLRKLIISLLCIMLLAGTMPAASFAVDAADGESSNTNAQETIQEPAQNTEGSASDSDTATNDPAATSQPQTSGSAEEATVPEAADISEEAAAKIQWAAHLDNHTQIVPFFSVFVLCFLNSFVMIQPLVLYFT